MKAIVLCAGAGMRLRPLTFSTPKHLIPVANKPVLFYCIESLVAAGARQIALVVSPDSRELIREAVGDGHRWSAQVAYVEQATPHGLAHAVQCAQSFVGTDPFIMYLGDTLIPEGLVGAVDLFSRSGANAVVAVKGVDDPSRCGIVALDGDRIVRLVEKPAQPIANLAIAGAYVFDHHIFESIEHIRPSSRNEYEITDAIQHLIDRGLSAVPYVLHGWWQDTGQPRDLLAANRVMLQGLAPAVHGSVDAASTTEGAVWVGTGAIVIGSHIRGPTIIGAQAHIVDSDIGPFTSIGDRVQIAGTRVENSIVMDDCVIRQLRRPLVNSLLGRRVQVTGALTEADSIELLLGDCCEARLP